MLYMFDFDGTIVDNKGIFRRAFVSLLNKHNKEFDEEEVLNRQYGSFIEMLEGFKNDFFSNMQNEEFHEEYRLACIDLYVLLEPKEGFLKYLETLKNDKVIIATRNDYRVVLAWLNKYKLDIELVTESDIFVRKDEDEFYNVMAKRYNVSNNEMVLFEDDDKNLETAFRNGVKTIGVSNRQSEEKLEVIKNNTSMIIDDYNILLEKGI